MAISVSSQGGEIPDAEVETAQEEKPKGSSLRESRYGGGDRSRITVPVHAESRVSE